MCLSTRPRSCLPEPWKQALGVPIDVQAMLSSACLSATSADVEQTKSDPPLALVLLVLPFAPVLKVGVSFSCKKGVFWLPGRGA